MQRVARLPKAPDPDAVSSADIARRIQSRLSPEASAPSTPAATGPLPNFDQLIKMPYAQRVQAMNRLVVPATAPPSATDISTVVSPQDFFGPDVDITKLPGGMQVSNNPGNLKWTGSQWQQENLLGALGPSRQLDEGDPQVMFANPLAGMASLSRLIDRYVSSGNADTLQSFFQTYTPNNVADASTNIANAMGIKATDPIDLTNPATRAQFMRALITQEQGPSGLLYSDDLIRQGIAVAAGAPQGGPVAGPIPAHILETARDVALSGGAGGVARFMASQGYPMDGNWCGEFAAAVVTAAGGTPPEHPEVASNWRNWGTPVEGAPQPGDVAVKRGTPTGETGSHVTFVETYDPKTGRFIGIGGNQSSFKSSMAAGSYDFYRSPSGAVLAAIGGRPGTQAYWESTRARKVAQAPPYRPRSEPPKVGSQAYWESTKAKKQLAQGQAGNARGRQAAAARRSKGAAAGDADPYAGASGIPSLPDMGN